jgi:energy-coupling factor transporter ATP-binding protein EcfA2
MAMNNVTKMHSEITLPQVVDLIAQVGDKVTVLVQGHIGSGKSSIHKILQERFPNHYPVYFDCTTKADSGDISVPKFVNINGTDVVSFVPNEEFGLHQDKPVLLMIDELGKNKAILNPLTRLMLERVLGTYKLPEGSIVFATTNLGAENVGDMLPPHVRNRICVVKMEKTKAMPWVEDFAIPNALHPVVIGTAVEYPQIYESFEDVEDPNSNPDIYHPKQLRAAFVTHRSMHRASDIMFATEGFTDNVRIHALMGVVGESAAMKIMTISRLNDDMPAYERVIADPEGCPLPKSGVSACMMVAKIAIRVERETFDNCLTYLQRMSKEVQALFARTIMRSPKKNLAASHKSFVAWASENMYLFS